MGEDRALKYLRSSIGILYRFCFRVTFAGKGIVARRVANRVVPDCRSSRKPKCTTFLTSQLATLLELELLSYMQYPEMITANSTPKL